MDKSKEFEFLKKNYGERFAKMCRTFFPSILENEGLLSEIISKTFAPNLSIFDDLNKAKAFEDFKNYIYSLYEKRTLKEEYSSKENIEDPFKLMEKAGYKLFECKTNEDVLKFKKYWKEEEALCTFRSPNRIEHCHIFFAVKENAEKLKREDFTKPERQDEYGTSVISLQFTRKSPNLLSIKNRYNHTVYNPDATFSNDLENIYPGLTESFKRAYKFILLEEKTKFELPNYVLADDGRFYRYNLEHYGECFCSDNVIVQYGGEFQQLDKTSIELIDYFKIDKKNKKITSLLLGSVDSFPQTFPKILSIDTKIKGKIKTLIFKTVTGEDIVIVADKNNRMIGYKNNYIKEVPNDFLCKETGLEYIEMNNLEIAGSSFLSGNNTLKKLSLPKLKSVSSDFLHYNLILEELSLPSLEKLSNDCLCFNDKLKSVNLPNLKVIGNSFLKMNTKLTELNLPNVEQIGYGFLTKNEICAKLTAPKLRVVGEDFCLENQELTEISLPSLSLIGGDGGFLYCNEKIEKVELPNLKNTSSYFLFSNEMLVSLNLPKLEVVRKDFLHENTVLEELVLPSLKTVDGSICQSAKHVKKISSPSLKIVDGSICQSAKHVKKISSPMVRQIRKKMGEGNLIVKKIKEKVDKAINTLQN